MKNFSLSSAEISVARLYNFFSVIELKPVQMLHGKERIKRNLDNLCFKDSSECLISALGGSDNICD